MKKRGVKGKNRAKREKNPLNFPPCGCKIDFSLFTMIHLHKIYALVTHYRKCVMYLWVKTSWNVHDIIPPKHCSFL